MNRIVLNLFWIILLISACNKGTDQPDVVPVLDIMPLNIQERNVNFTACVNIRLSEASDKPVTVTIRTEDGTALENEDYSGITNRKIEFLPGRISQDVCIQIIGDEEHEDDEYFHLVVTDVSGAEVTTSKGLVTIENDDVNSTVRIPGRGYSTPESYTGMDLIWRDEFDTSIDPDKWTFEIGNGNDGWGNAERQYYTKENAMVRDGHLVITARKEWFSGFDYTSTRMKTMGNFSFKYGRVDIRAALPYGQGIWPALWMLGSNIPQVGWPACGEIDIMELIGGGEGRDDTVHGTAHWQENNTHAKYGQSVTLGSGIFNDEFHVFSIVWDENSIRWYLDEKLYNTFDIRRSELSEFHEDFYLIVNLAVGGRWPGYPDGTTTFPQHLIVDYIRVFQDK